MSNIDEILSFCVNLSRQMVLSGANLERVNAAVAFICKAYQLEDVSIFSLSSHMSIAAKDKAGNYSSRQISIPPSGIHLERLKSLNRLSYKVTEIKPNPKFLDKMLERAVNVQEYPDIVVLLGRILAMSCLCFMFGGTFSELIPVAVVTALIHFITPILETTGLDRIVMNAFIMFLAGSCAILFTASNMSNNFPVILITVSMLVIPGIPLVNSMRNLLCGHEINGILQMLKIFIETMALGMGVYLALVIFSGFIKINATSQPLTHPYFLIALSFIASVGFGVVFRIKPQDLIFAGLGGALARIALLTLTPVISSRLLYMTLSASVAALYAEFFAVTRRQPSTYFIYPSIIPLIPGDLFFYALVGLYLGDYSGFETHGINCVLSLLGLSIGFVLSSTFAHHVRKVKFRRFNQ
ncbi:MAG: threonine/serine exporter family protein [Synergistaceae bacterium]|nr:threonine/serine exporter family protein [Synergistaceae bacterium]